MIAVDTNILVYAHREESSFHQNALRCITGLAEGNSPWAIPWPCIHEFFSIVTHPRIYDPPTPLPYVLDQIDAWLGSPALNLLTEATAYWQALRLLLESSRVSGPMVHDARIAALCLQHGVVVLLPAAREFTRFPNPTPRQPLDSDESEPPGLRGCRASP